MLAMVWLAVLASGPTEEQPKDLVAPVTDPVPEEVPAEPEAEPAPEEPQEPATEARSVPEGFVDLSTLGIDVEARYATSNNFTGAPIAGYGAPAVWMRTASAEALAKVDSILRPKGLALRVYDGYRPQRASKAMVAWAERENRQDLLKDGYIAAKSGHNNGDTVDLTLVDLKNGEPLDMGSDYDFFGPESHTINASTTEVRLNRRQLLQAMFKQGFRNYSKEWWHYRFAKGSKEGLDVPYGCAEPLTFSPPPQNTPEAWAAIPGMCAAP